MRRWLTIVSVQPRTIVVFDIEIVHVTAVFGGAFSKILEYRLHLNARDDRSDARHIISAAVRVRWSVVAVSALRRRLENNGLQRRANALSVVTGPVFGPRRKLRVQRLTGFRQRFSADVVWNNIIHNLLLLSCKKQYAKTVGTKFGLKPVITALFSFCFAISPRNRINYVLFYGTISR